MSDADAVRSTVYLDPELHQALREDEEDIAAVSARSREKAMDYGRSLPGSRPMARYERRVRPSVAKDLRGVPKPDVKRILACMESLRDEPRGPGCDMLAGGSEHWRARQGRYRIVYRVDGGAVVVDAVRLGRRRGVYRSS